MELRHSFTLKDVSDWIYNMKRHQETWTNPEAKKTAEDCAKALEAFYNFQIKTGCPINNQFIATDKWIQ